MTLAFLINGNSIGIQRHAVTIQIKPPYVMNKLFLKF